MCLSSNTVSEYRTIIMASSKSGDARSKFKMRPDLGRIHFKLRYDDDKRVLYVTVVECSQLKRIDLFDKCNPFVRVYLLPGNHDVMKTKVIKKSLNPVFKKKIMFQHVGLDK